MGNGATDQSEGAGGNKWVAPINMNVGDVYILVIDNWSESNSPFDLDIDLSGGASLDCVPLPIDLLSFSGDAVKIGNELYWQTISEINNDYFILEASVDANSFIEIGNIDGAGNSSQLIDYYFLDKTPISSTTYYRLKQVDFNGKFSYSDVISIKRDKYDDIFIYPNPTNDVLNIEIKSSNQINYTISVINIVGEEIHKTNYSGNSKITLDVFSKLSTGVYFVNIKDEYDNVIITKKIIKYLK